MPDPTGGFPLEQQTGGRRKTRRNGMSVKALKRALKKAGLKTTGKKAALTKRAKKAHLMRGGDVAPAGCYPSGDTSKPRTKDSKELCAFPNKYVDPADMEDDGFGGGRRRPRKGRRGGNDNY
jgi:hypothetical protein